VVDEDAAHEAARDREEVRPVLPPHVPLFEEAQEGLVDEGGRVQGVAGSTAPQPVGRLATQLAVHAGDNLVAGLLVATAPGVQQLGEGGVSS
jgi:hypothetical protein